MGCLTPHLAPHVSPRGNIDHIPKHNVESRGITWKAHFVHSYLLELKYTSSIWWLEQSQQISRYTMLLLDMHCQQGSHAINYYDTV